MIENQILIFSHLLNYQMFLVLSIPFQLYQTWSALGNVQNHWDMNGDLAHGVCVHIPNIAFFGQCVAGCWRPTCGLRV